MVDTTRTRAALVSLLASGVQDGIDAQDLRDLLASVLVVSTGSGPPSAAQTDARDVYVDTDTGHLYVPNVAVGGTEWSLLPPRLDSPTELKAVDGTVHPMAVVKRDNVLVPYVWESSIPVATHTADTDELVYVAPNLGLDGAWVALLQDAVPLAIAGGGPGVADNTTGLVKAANAAKRLGSNQVYLHLDAPVTTEVGLGDVADTTFVGREIYDITGSAANRPNRKWVTPRTRGNAYAFMGNDVIPHIHLERVNRAARNGTIKVAIVGESVGTYRPGAGYGRMDLKADIYRSTLAKAFPGVTVNLQNFSIAGQTFDDWDKTGTTMAGEGITMANYPWFSTLGNTWFSYIEAFAPDLVIIALGQNNAGTNLLVSELQDVATEIESWTTVPSILWETPLSQSAQYSGTSSEDRINRLDAVAGLIRSFARYNGNGVIDMHRMGCLAIAGFDPRYSSEFGAEESLTPATGAPATTTSARMAMNWRVKITFDASSWTNGSADYIRVRTGWGTGADYAQIKKLAGGTWQVLWVGGYTGGTVTEFTNTSYTAATGASSTLIFEVNDDMLVVYDDDTATGTGKEPIWSTPIVRQGGLALPYVVVSSTTNIPTSAISVWHGRPRTAIPLITDTDVWVPETGTWGGTTSINHPSSVVAAYVYRMVLEQITWRVGMLEATAANIRAGAANVAITPATMEDAAEYATLTDGATVNLDWSTGINFDLTLGGNRTLANPTNGEPGTTRHVRVIQDGTGSRTLTWGANYKFAGGTAPTLTTTAAAVDTFTIMCVTTSRFEVYTAGLDMK